MRAAAVLALEDGSVFWGESIGAQGSSVGEVVFNTSQTGYQEILTDPSYAKQLITLTATHIGNVGVNPQDMEAQQIIAAGLIIRNLSLRVSNWRATESLSEFLTRHQIKAIAGIDTRALTRKLREQGVLKGCIMTGDVNEAETVARAQAFTGMNGLDLAKEVSTKKQYSFNKMPHTLHPSDAISPLKYHVVVYDFGVKENILRMLVAQGCELTVVSAQTPVADVLKLNPDGVVLSNGPGDPAACDYAIAATKQLLEANIPLFGICLGCQLLALACGGRTEKMKFGHRGANHPVIELASGRVFISSQNHGFAVAEDNLPKNLMITHRSLFDNTVQGIRVLDKPAFAFQGHPEASPGPLDVAYLFVEFEHMLAQYKIQRTQSKGEKVHA